MSETFPPFSDTMANGSLNVEEPRAQQARFLDTKLPSGFALSSTAGAGLPRIIDMASLDPKIFSIESGNLIVIKGSNREQVGINALDAVTTLVHACNPGALQDFFNPETTFNLSHTSEALNFKIVKEATSEYQAHQLLDISCNNGIQAKIRYEQALDGRWHLTISKVEPANDWFNDGVEPWEDPEALNLDFLVAREFLISKDLFQPGHKDGGLWCYALTRPNQTPTKIQPLHDYKAQTGSTKSQNVKELKAAVVQAFDNYAEHAGVLPPAKGPLIKATETLIEVTDCEGAPDLLREQIEKVKSLLDEALTSVPFSNTSAAIAESKFLVLN